MKFLLSLATTLLLATEGLSIRTCGSNHPPAELIEKAILFRAMSKFKPGPNSKPVEEDPVPRKQVVPLHIHNVFINATRDQGYITHEDVQNQFKVLNDNFLSTGVSFDLKTVTHTEDKAWAMASRGSTAEINMKKTLRRGGYADLNIYIRPLRSGLLGYCTFPEDIVKGSDKFFLDGCDVLFSSVPGGSTTYYDEGKTATHEVGHWFGLFHTFQGGCSGGDLVDDTPAEGSPTNGCPIGKDTCKGDMYPGLDPIHNYMDYSYDACMNEFTDGQRVRLYQMWDQYRVHHGSTNRTVTRTSMH
ncbi:hypothetical protein TWF225_007862 [Orbilia oligospora]|uniref:Uncharacterized protein n=1 Tax=Orbilia oligospora TaxID=2813651 RepID=A0A7C8PCC7_ORBOL|nr:hypothetical protein TWF751_008053 [Orbilia oligospora]KAF3178557.1 hypothetical protein TWF225_007862 [Orbilia oligospora]KAF3243071.1 hypothetical protein TWF217_011389 [Orbilia oligospora]KAF3260167.1 hypothetical protein TWF128_003636 [Orbilia oligospora]KAF3292097.1 hypothetical protein TWF132_006337 [Orbilia oligospora]